MFPSGEQFYLDEKDGERGYNTDPARGADTFVPFKGKPKIVQIGSGNTLAANTFSATSIKGYQKLTSNNFFLKPSPGVRASGSSTNNSTGGYSISYNPTTGIVTVGKYIAWTSYWDRPFEGYISYGLYAYV